MDVLGLHGKVGGAGMLQEWPWLNNQQSWWHLCKNIYKKGQSTAQREKKKYARKNPTNTKGRAEGVAGGTPGPGADSPAARGGHDGAGCPLQPVERTTL